MAIKRHVPNVVTLLNLFCGSIAVIFAVYNNFVAAAIFVFLGIFFDFFDGLLARKLNVQSPLGLQLDSLADMVTSGLVPGLVMFKLLSLAVDTPLFFNASTEWNSNFDWQEFGGAWLPLLGLLITLSSAYRLAKFNLDEDQQTYFKGLPTPANALLILSLPLILEFQESDLLNALILNKWFLIILTLISSYLLNSPVKLFALKFKNYGFKDNAVRYVFVVMTLVLIALFQFAAIPLIIAMYILMSLVSSKFSKQ